jgi:phosphoenolpyruvate carboxylase
MAQGLAERGRAVHSRPEAQLGRLIRALETFGFHLATLDMRQNSAVHERVVAELLQGEAGVATDYARAG